MKRQLIFIFILLISVFSFSQKKSDRLEDLGGSPIDYGIYENTSFMKLIANSEKYNGKMIQMIGYLHLEFEGNAIYFHKEDYENCISENAFWVSFPESITNKADIMKYSDKYVIIIGTFNMNDTGHMGLFGGSIDNIVRLGTWCDWKDKK